MRFMKILLVCLASVLLLGITAHHGAVVGGATKPQQKPFIVADGGDPLPRPPLVADGGDPLSRPAIEADGGDPLPRPPLVADGGDPLPRPTLRRALGAGGVSLPG